jgi:hypothetical protein
MRFGDLEHGDEFYYNCFKWKKDTMIKKRNISRGLFNNAKNLTDYGHTAYFEDHVEVKPITKEEE